MSSVLGVSVGAGAVRVARPFTGDSTDPTRNFAAAQPRYARARSGFDGPPDAFDVQAVPVGERRVDELVADAVGAVLAADSRISATAIAYRDENHARAIRAELARRQFTNYELVPDVVAALEFLEYSGELQGFGTVALYDLGASGLSVTVVDIGTRQVCFTERTSDISGDYLDALIREQQIASGRIAHPPDHTGLVALDKLCREAKEQLSGSSAVALPSTEGLVLLSQENFEALIMLAVESSARMTRDVILRSEQPVQAVALLGGCAQIPLVARVLRRWLGVPVIVPAAPDTVVTRGAAMLARPVMPRPAPAPFPAAPREETAPYPAEPAAARPLGSGTVEKFGRRREVSLAGVAVGALVVVAAIGITLGWGTQVLSHDSQRQDAVTSSVPTSTTRPSEPVTAAPSTTDATNESLAPLPQPQNATTTTEAPTTTVGPNTITLIPGLPPVVVPTLPPLFPPPPAQQ
ncbi:Hsp70 family protein [Nocardia tengchongensis]|uniref:Hsp70 family protein n=1 Tax=Nocardia tengchongensis TaxID=2055889 RepID=A0ABX8CR39_9NOCA|nr:Hsp70 family protein [Nocardia tengchongensis]QVI22385.1 Hsp70 family protein [Nocardia tengchongensis]